jgi:biotin carboxyl carrier protein
MKVTITIEGKQYQVSIDDLNTRPILAEVDGKTYEVWPEEADAPVASTPTAAPVATPAASAAPAPAPAAGAQTLTAPLPGVIISIEVREGETVKNGQELYVLEAMKMKNSILADRDGKIAAIHVSAGDQVRHNQPVMSFEG